MDRVVSALAPVAFRGNFYSVAGTGQAGSVAVSTGSVTRRSRFAPGGEAVLVRRRREPEAGRIRGQAGAPGRQVVIDFADYIATGRPWARGRPRRGGRGQ